MKRFILIVPLLLCSCSVKQYSTRIALPQQTLFPASPDLTTTDSGLAQGFERTTLYCGQVKQAISTELDQRQFHLELRKIFVTSVGTTCGGAATYYNSVVTNPDKRVTGVLSACATGAILSAIPIFNSSPRSDVLVAKMSTIDSLQSVVIDKWNNLENILKNKQDVTMAEADFRKALSDYGNSCQ